MSSPSFKRAGAAAVGAAVLAAGLTAVAPTPAAHAATDPGPAADAAGWLAEEFSSLTTAEAGRAIDYGLAVEATGGPAEVLTSLTAELDEVLGAFLPPADPAPSHWDAINVAMAADYYSTVGAVPPEETDLFDRFTGMVDETGQFGPVAWSYSQTYAVSALRNVDNAESDAFEKAREFLVDSQCEGGFWGFDATCPPDVDGTALAVLALLPDADLPAVGTAIDDAVAWLKTQQRADGGFGDWGTNVTGTTSSGPSTGLAGWALGAAGETEVAAEAAAWLRVHQAAPIAGCATPLNAETGAVAFDEDYLDAAVDGIPAGDRGSWQLSTAQAYAGLTFLPEGQSAEMGMTARSFLDGGSITRFVVDGLRAGERGCLKLGAKRTWFRGNLAGRAVVKARVPDRTGFIAVSAATVDAAIATETVVLSAKRLPVDLRSDVPRRGTQRVAVRGLYAGERVVVKHDGDVVARGRATAEGTFVTTFGVGRRRGEHTVKVVGQFADRAATKSFQVG